MRKARKTQERRDPETYRVVYLVRGRRERLSGDHTLETATKRVGWLKRRGFTAWVVTEGGRFQPVEGARREPAWIE